MSTSGSFDPYEKWLGIPPHQQPPDHYRLLGLKPFEQDRQEIQRHAEQRLRQVNMYRRGPHVRLCEELIHKINVAKACLLNPSLKPSYDQKLQGMSADARAAVDAPAGAAVAAAKTVSAGTASATAGLPAGKPPSALRAQKRAGPESLADLTFRSPGPGQALRPRSAVAAPRRTAAVVAGAGR